MNSTSKYSFFQNNQLSFGHPLKYIKFRDLLIYGLNIFLTLCITHQLFAADTSLLGNQEYDDRALIRSEVPHAGNRVGSDFSRIDIPPTQICAQPPDDLLAWWSGEGNGLPEIGNYTAVLGNGANYRLGKVGQAFQFDGINDYVDIGTFGVLPTYTVALWFNADIVDTNRTFISQDRAGYNDDFMLGIEPEGHFYGNDFRRIAVVYHENNTQSRFKIRDTVDITPGRWYFVAVTYDGTTMRLWVDGVEKDSVVAIGLAISDQQWNLGQNSHYFPFGSYRNFAGQIDEPIIAGRAFTESEINSIYLAGQAGICKDTTPPISSAVTSPDANEAGWNNSNVGVSLSATDNVDGSGVSQITYSASGAQTIAESTVNSSNVNLTITAEGETVIFYYARDNAGNTEETKTLTIRIDKTAPVITVTSPTTGNYLLNQNVAVNFSCSDERSGVSSCTGTTANGTSLNTATIGAKTFTVDAADNAGNNTAPTNVNYTVAFGIEALFDQTKAHKSGSTVPIKIRLVDANGTNVSSAGTVVHAVSVIQIGSQASTILDDAGSSNPDFDFRYDQSLSRYIFNLKTTGYGTGTYQLNFTAGNGSTVYSVQFQVRQ